MSEPRFPGHHLTLVLALAWVTLSLPWAASAEVPSAIVLSSDTSVVLGGVAVDDQTAAREALAGGVSLLPLGALPADADLEALAAAEGDWLLVLDTSAELTGGLIAGPNDVVRFDGTSFVLELNGSTVGLPAGSAIDALARLPSGALLLSFDTTLRLGGTAFDDEDLAEFSAGAFNMFFDGSAGGISPSLDLDAVAYDSAGGRLFLSFDGSGTVPGGLAFDDEDVLELELGTSAWSLAYDGSSQHSLLPAADLDALEIELPSSTIFANGFESGDTSGWTVTVQ